MCDRSIEILNELFGAVIDEHTMRSVVEFYNGNLTPSIEALMKIADDLNQSEASKTALDNSIPDSTQPKMSYRTAFEKNKHKEFKNNSPQPKQQTDVLSIYSNKTDIQRVIDSINEGHKLLVFIRGLPGSGKSTLAKNIVKTTVKNNTGHIFSSDDYFNVNGRYIYNRERIGDAHQWNQSRVGKAITQGLSPIIVDNTNLEIWEMHIYTVNGVLNGYIIEVLEALTPWSNRPGELSQKSVHNVPLNKIKRMNEKFERNVTGKILMDYFRLKYPPNQMPPQQRLVPRVVPYNNSPSCSNVSPLRRESNLKKNGLIDSSRFVEGVANSNGNAFDSEVVSSTSNSKSVNTFSSPFNATNSEYRYDQMACSKPQRSRRTELLKNFESLSEWKPIGDWECFDGEVDGALINEKKISFPVTHFENASTQTVHSTIEDQSQYKQLIPVSRSINTSNNNSCDVRMPKQTMKLDKGIMTDEEETNPNSDVLTNKDKMKELKSLFAHIPNVHIRDILEKCNGDVNWACEILLDADINGDNLFTQTDQEDEWDEECHEGSEQNDTEMDVEEEACEVDDPLLQCTPEQPDVKEKTSSDISDIKRQIEENFVIADDHYSDHVLKLRRKIHGDTRSDSESSSNASGESPSALDEIKRASQTEEDKKVTIEEMDDEEPECEEIESISVRVGHDFIGELNRIYKTPFYDCTLEPVIHIPENLLNQIHALWIESLCNQIDVQKERTEALIQEDEEFARNLMAQEAEEERLGHQSEVPNLREIMEMEMDLARYNMAQSEWKNESPNDLATKLSKQKLIQLFPDLNENVLMEVLHAYNYNFGAAFEDLLLSTGKVTKSQTNEIDPKDFQRILAEQEKDLIDRTLQERNKELAMPAESHPSTSSTVQDPKKLVEIYRQEAKELMNLRNTHLAKAQQYSTRKMFGTANYYSNLANLYSKKHDYINTLAASEIVLINTKDNNTLDLHCFYVKEALQALDMYLDLNIRTLRERNKKPFTAKLYLITGRGIHSPGQTARIKPVVKRRLKERHLKYSEVNPGLLSVVITAQDVLTDFM